MSRVASLSVSVLTWFYFFMLLISSPGIARVVVVDAARPISGLNSGNYATFKPKTSHDHQQQHTFQSGSGVNDCLPKGFHHSSAPSRYINYHTFGSTMCSTTKHPSSP
ncbi:hypothetical protein ACOSQ3_033405 [Xanthoceras sorbifolium]